MSETVPALRVLLLDADEVPPLEAAPEGAAEEDATWMRLELDAFLAALDAGEAAPDLVLVPGADPAVLAALRGHPAACCLPVYAVGATPPGAGGWDGVVTAWSPALVEQVRGLAAAGQGEPSREPLESARRAHGFARFLASRGSARLEDARAFGIRAPRSLAQEWQGRGWLAVDEHDDGLLVATPALREAARWSRLTDPAAASVPGGGEAAESPQDPEPREPRPVEPPAEPGGPEEPQPVEPPDRPQRPEEPRPSPDPEEPRPLDPPEREPAPQTPEETPPEEPGPWPASDPEPVPTPPPPRGRRALLATTAAVVLVLVSARAAAEAGLMARGGAWAWLAGEAPEAVAWQPPRPAGPRLVVPAGDAQVASRLAAGDPAFRPAAPGGAAQREAAGPVAGEETPVEEARPAGDSEQVSPTAPQAVDADPRPAVPAAPEVLTVGVLREPLVLPLAFPLPDGSVAEWQAASGDRVQAGQVLALLDDPRVAARVAELEAMREGFAGERAARLDARRTAWREEQLRRDAAASEAALRAAAATGRVEQLEAVHARNLQLVQEGVLGYAEIRSDWDALLAAREELRAAEVASQEAIARVESHAAAVPEAEPPGAAEAMLLARLESALADARAEARLVAPRTGILRGPLAGPGLPLAAGAEVARIEAPDAAEGVVRLAPGEADWLDGRLVLSPADGVRLPVTVRRVDRAADGGWLLRFPWPEGLVPPVDARIERPR